MRTSTAVLLLCSACLLASGLAAGAGALRDETAPLIRNRFGRQLRQVEAAVPGYLIPDEYSHRCTGDDCCQEDDYASPYRVVMLNSSKSSSGGRTYTTFFMNLTMTAQCYSAVDNAGCCNANISTVWIDVDPELKVKFATLNGEPAAIQAQQDAYGFRMAVEPKQYEAFRQPGVVTITVTVEGSADNLCPLPDIAPLEGLCDVILEGGNSTDAGACCPRGLSQFSAKGSSWVPPSDYFTCVSDPVASPFDLQLTSVSDVFNGVGGTKLSNYTLTLKKTASTCKPGPNSCCSMELSYLTVKIMAGVNVFGVYINNNARPVKIGPYNQGQVSYQNLLVENLGWDVDSIPDEGKQIIVAVQIGPADKAVPQLCSVPAQGALAGKYGSCSFYMHSDDGFCCPSGATAPVDGPGPFPPPLPGSCDPQFPVPIVDTSMLLQYYEHTTTPTTNDFTFLVTSNNNAACKISKAYCADVCGWTLFVRDEMLDSISYNHYDPANKDRLLVQRGADASVTFTYGPSGSGALTYGISAPVGLTLAQLCRPNAHPNQGNKPCAAMVKSNANVYSMVFFDEPPAIDNYPPPIGGICSVYSSMDDSCMRIDNARFNVIDAPSQVTVVDFQVGNLDSAVTGCTSDTSMTFRVVLQAGVVSDLSTRNNAVKPQNVVYNSSASSLLWTSTPSNVNGTAHYTFNVKGAKTTADICVQGLKDQPAGTCAVQFQGRSKCFIGFVNLTRDTSLIWTDITEPDSGSSNASVIAPAVVVPIVAIIGLALLAFFLVRRRREREAARSGGSGSGDALAAPLVGATLSEGELQRPSVAASDVQVQLPSS